MHRPKAFPAPHPTTEEAVGAQGFGRDTAEQLTQERLHVIWCYAQQVKLGKEEGRRDLHRDGVPKQLWNSMLQTL